MNIKQCRLDRGYNKYAEEYKNKACEVLESANYILGNEVKLFEDEFAKYNARKYCIGVASGTDALFLALRCLSIGTGDEVILPANSYVADYLSIVNVGAVPVPIDIGTDFLIDCQKIKEKINEKTKAILAVHLYGGAANMMEINNISKEYNLKVIEDCAQAVGTTLNENKVGIFGDISCFSFYPTKNLGAFGDGGAILTDDENIAEKARSLRFYGSLDHSNYMYIGANSRLDELQAGLLRIRLKHLNEFLADRKKSADLYYKSIINDTIVLPKYHKNIGHTFHQFVIMCDNREKLRDYLSKNGIETKIHYPILPYLTEAYEFLDYKVNTCIVAESLNKKIISLPMYDGITADEIEYISETINHFA